MHTTALQQEIKQGCDSNMVRHECQNYLPNVDEHCNYKCAKHPGLACGRWQTAGCPSRINGAVKDILLLGPVQNEGERTESNDKRCRTGKEYLQK